MAYDVAHTAWSRASAGAQDDFRRHERFAVLIGGAASGILAGVVAALALGRTGWWPLMAAAPMFAVAAYLAVATFRDALDRRALGCSIAAGLVALSLLAWPAMALMFPTSTLQFWVAPMATAGAMILLASCWTGVQGAVYRLCAEAASVFAIVGFLGLTELMS